MATSNANVASSSVSFPPLQVKWLKDDGTVSLPWYTFLFNLWQRSGGGSNSADISGLQAQIALAQQTANEAVADVTSVGVTANMALGQSNEAIILSTIVFGADAPQEPDLNILGLLALQTPNAPPEASLADLMAFQNASEVHNTTISIEGSQVKPEPTVSDFLAFALLSGR